MKYAYQINNNNYYYINGYMADAGVFWDATALVMIEYHQWCAMPMQSDACVIIISFGSASGLVPFLPNAVVHLCVRCSALCIYMHLRFHLLYFCVSVCVCVLLSQRSK